MRAVTRRYWNLFVATVSSNLGDGVSSIAYPWLASAVTRNPMLISLIVVAQKLPWLLFTLPAGVITDRVDRRKTTIAMDVVRGLLTLIVAIGVFDQQHRLPAPGDVSQIVATSNGLYVVLLITTLLLGCAEVLRDNCALTIVPAVVDESQLETANGRMWAAESIANTFVGPMLGPLLLAVAFSVPFFFDAASFFASAGLVAAIGGTFRPPPAAVVEGAATGWRSELVEGCRWLWSHELLRPMAIILGFMNLASTLSTATMVLFAQEVLGVGAFGFTAMTLGWAFGGALGSVLAPRMTAAWGPARCLAITLATPVVVSTSIGLSSTWIAVAVVSGVGATLSATWNVITVSMRQRIIPDHLFGRVNSVYRFFALGMMPIGAAIGGVIIAAVTWRFDRSAALRTVWFVDAGVHLVLFQIGRRVLTTERIEAAQRV